MPYAPIPYHATFDRHRRIVSEFETTLTELKAIAAPAIMGLSWK